MDRGAWDKARLLPPDGPGAAARVALLEYLASLGATLEQIVEAHASGNLPGLAGELVVGRERPPVPVADIAARAHVSYERLGRVLLAAGLPVTADGTLPVDLVEVMSAFEQGAGLMGEDAILAFTRVLGAAAITIAEAAVALFYAEMGPGAPREGTDELARARAAEMATLAFANVPDALSRLLLAQFERAARRTQLSRGWSSPDGIGTGAERGGGAPEQTALGEPSEKVALGFIDLVGSTAWAEGLSLREQNLALSRFESAAWSRAVLAEGRVIKMIGDEVFISAPSVESACRIAVDICRSVAADPVLPPARGAVGYGAVVPREGDYFGPLVNLVARLVKVAVPGTLVITEEAAQSLPGEGWTLEDLGLQQLRGLGRPVRAFAAAPAPGG